MKDRCIGVFDLESPELDAFNKSHVEVLTLLASQASVAIENARLYETIRHNEIRLEKEILFAQRVQAALLPTELPKRLKGVDVAGRLAPARELGGDLYDFLTPEPNSLVIAVGDVSGKGVPAALYSAFAGELVRSRTFRRRFTLERSSPAGVLGSMNTILYERQLEEYYCTLCYASFDLKRRVVTFANSGLPYPIRVTGSQSERGQATLDAIEMPGVPLGAFPGSSYDEVIFELAVGDLYVFCTDGVFEAQDPLKREFGAEGLMKVIEETRHMPARGDRGRHFRRRARVPRRHDPERRHDRGGDQDHRADESSIDSHRRRCIEVFFPDVKADRLTAEDRDFVDPAFDVHARATCRRPRALRDHGDFACPIINLVHPERHERHTPRTGHDAVDPDGAVLIAPGIVLEVGDVRCTKRAGRHEAGQHEDGNETQETGHGVLLSTVTFASRSCVGSSCCGRRLSTAATYRLLTYRLPTRRPRRIVNVMTGYGDASACLKLRIPVTRRDCRGVIQFACPRKQAKNIQKIRPVRANRPCGETPRALFSEVRPAERRWQQRRTPAGSHR